MAVNARGLGLHGLSESGARVIGPYVYKKTSIGLRESNLDICIR